MSGNVEFEDGRSYDRKAVSKIIQQWLDKHMKQREIEFTKSKTLSLFCGSWNVNAKKLEGSLDDWLLPQNGNSACDVYAIGFQEIVDLNAINVAIDGSKTLQRSLFWQEKIHECLVSTGFKYIKVADKHLVGLLVVIFVKDSVYPYVKDIKAASIGVGLMGVMGNKGGVAIRMSLYDSSICFVCSHLAAHRENVVGRNSDYKNIVERLVFLSDSITREEDESNYEALSTKPRYGSLNLNSDTQILDHEFVFWFGDLNYRIDDSVSKEDVFKHIESKNISYLRQNDQLNIERSNGRVFQGFVEEELNFYPTYKFQPGTDLYEQRPEKKLRAPAFCDRILWRTKNNPSSVRISSYLSSKLLPSDHKPVLAVFSTDVKEIVAEKERSVYNELMKKLDQSNTVESIILAEISGLQIDLLDVKYNVPTVSDITIKNIGNTTIYWHFIPKVEESLFSKKWVCLDITSGLLLPGEITIISVKVLIDKKTAQSLNQAKETLDDIIQLRIENYNDFFVNIHAKYLRSCFGVSLEELVHTMVPIRNTPMPTLPYSSKAVMPQTAATSPKLGIPKELWRLVDALWTGDCIREKDLFAFEAAVTELEQICDCLDEGKCFPKCSPHALSQTLVSWIEALPNQLLPSRLYPTSEIESNQLRNWSRKFLESLPPLNYTVFVYIISFFREVLAQAEYNRSTPLRLAEVCVGCMLPSPLDPELTKDEKERRIGKQQIMLPVIMHFLSSTSI